MKALLRITTILLFVFLSNNLFALQSNTSSSKIPIQTELHQKILDVWDYTTDPPKSQIFTFFLATFFGLFGLHRFYLNKNKSGYLKIALTIVSTLSVLLLFAETAFFLVVFPIIAIVWYVSDVINILNGNLKPENNNYVT